MAPRTYLIRICPEHENQVALGDSGELLCPARGGHEVKTPLTLEVVATGKVGARARGEHMHQGIQEMIQEIQAAHDLSTEQRLERLEQALVTTQDELAFILYFFTKKEAGHATLGDFERVGEIRERAARQAAAAAEAAA